METNKIKDKEKAKVRALRYALSLVCFQEVGMGEDENLGIVRGIVNNIKYLCKNETGIEISGYPIDFIKDNLRKVIELLPFTLIKFKRDFQEIENKIALNELEK